MGYEELLDNQQNTADNFIDTASVSGPLKKMSERPIVRLGPQIVKIRDVSGSAIWGNFDWNERRWNDEYHGGFELADAFYGILGQNALGNINPEMTIENVTNYNNIHYELFTTTQLKDTDNTTAVWTGDGVVAFNETEIAQSLETYKDTNNISSAKLVATTEESGVTFLYHLSADGGENWELVDNNVLHSFTNTGNDLRYKIVGIEGTGFPTLWGTWGTLTGPGFPTAWGTWGALEGGSARITRIVIQYNN